jgi:histidyl-tRNA synthetase
MVRGTRLLLPEETNRFDFVVNKLTQIVVGAGYHKILVPSIWEQQTFVDKAGPEILGQMYTFTDKGGRDLCLIPEVTAIVQEQYTKSWSKEWPKPVRIFYCQRCYRYERPQEGRYREFTQFGIELLGGKPHEDYSEVRDLLMAMLSAILLPSEWKLRESVKRGLSYYTEDGFEACAEILGAQKQVAGGGRYKEGIGFAVGVDRLALARKLCEEKS